MAELIPLMYKDVLRLDSCRSDAEVLDSMNTKLNDIISSYALSDYQLKLVIEDLNKILKETNLKLNREKGRVKAEKKKSFWNGFGIGSGGVIVLEIIILVLII